MFEAAFGKFALPPHSVWRRFLVYSLPSLIFCLGGAFILLRYEHHRHLASLRQSEQAQLLAGVNLGLDAISAEMFHIDGDLQILATDEEFQDILENPDAPNVFVLSN